MHQSYINQYLFNSNNTRYHTQTHVQIEHRLTLSSTSLPQFLLHSVLVQSLELFCHFKSSLLIGGRACPYRPLSLVFYF